MNDEIFAIFVSLGHAKPKFNTWFRIEVVLPN